MADSTDQLKLLHRLQETLGGKEAETLTGILSDNYPADTNQLKSDFAVH
jgi:hypothetical protein